MIAEKSFGCSAALPDFTQPRQCNLSLTEKIKLLAKGRCTMCFVIDSSYVALTGALISSTSKNTIMTRPLSDREIVECLYFVVRRKKLDKAHT